MEKITLINPETRHTIHCDHYKLAEIGIPDGYIKVEINDDFDRDKLAEKVMMAYLGHVNYDAMRLKNAAYISYEVAEYMAKARKEI